MTKQEIIQFIEEEAEKNEWYYLGQWTILQVILADLKGGDFNE